MTPHANLTKIITAISWCFFFEIWLMPPFCQSRTQSNACARARMALALGKLNFSCAVIGLTFINRACRQRTGTPKFRGSGCQFPQSQCHPSPRTGIALGTRLPYILYALKLKKPLHQRSFVTMPYSF
jgi:hypothetical protein